MAYLEEARSRSTTKSLNTIKEKPAYQLHFPEQWLSLMILLVALAAWQIAADRQWINVLFFPAPSIIARTLIETLRDGSLLESLTATLLRLATGTAIGSTSGLCVGLLMGRSRRLRVILDPFVAALYPMPKIALLPLVMIFFGIGESSKIALIAVSCFFPMLINTLTGVQQIPHIYWQVAENYGAKHWQLLTRVLLPGSLPLILSGIRIALNTALIVTLSVELLTAQVGLGSMIWFAWQTMRLRQLYATLIVIALLGSGFNLLVTRLAAWLAPWQADQIH